MTKWYTIVLKIIYFYHVDNAFKSVRFFAEDVLN